MPSSSVGEAVGAEVVADIGLDVLDVRICEPKAWLLFTETNGFLSVDAHGL